VCVIKKLFVKFLFIGLLTSSQFLLAQEKCSDLRLLQTEVSLSYRAQLISANELAVEIQSAWSKSKVGPSESEKAEVLTRLELVMEVIKPGGKLDQFFEENNLDPATAKIYLYGTTASYLSFNPLKPGHHWSKNSDIDFTISVKDYQGHYWRLARGPHKPTAIDGIEIEVQSLFLKREIDVHMANEFGMEILLPEADLPVPDYAILVRQPLIPL
jgi:hypothetical protein